MTTRPMRIVERMLLVSPPPNRTARNARIPVTRPSTTTSMMYATIREPNLANSTPGAGPAGPRSDCQYGGADETGGGMGVLNGGATGAVAGGGATGDSGGGGASPGRGAV